jgi:pimeloyl-ACP methyl ester carboxylesterase
MTTITRLRTGISIPTKGRHRLRRITAYVALGLCAVVVAASIPVYMRYDRYMGDARERLRSLDSKVATTALGSTEYATYGAGPPVLVIHGVLGGYDQGLLIARDQVGERFFSIVPSRFGYLRTPMPDAASAATQADAYAALLDQLGIQRVAVVGTSAGTASAIQFALRYPERTSALVLTSMSAGQKQSMPKSVARAVFGSDFIVWAATTYFPTQLGFGTPLNSEEKADREKAIETAHPASLRTNGTIFDNYVSTPSIFNLPVEQIAVPTLVINTRDDGMVKFDHARRMAERIPGVKFIPIERGGHVFLGQNRQVREVVTSFLTEHSSVTD